MDIFNIASALFGSSRVEETDGISNAVDSISAVGATDSESGNVGLTMDADITPADDVEGDETIFDVPTSPAVAAGDDVVMGLTGNGPLKVPIVLANPGSGDRQQAQINNAVELAEQAEAVAQATGQYFWSDTDGAHVTQVTKDDWTDSTSPNYHSGPNSLWNSLGMLFRDGLTNLLAILTNGIAIYDGGGNAASNILAEFTSDHMRVGGNIPTDGTSSASVQFFDGDADYGTAITATDNNSDGTGYHSLLSDVRITTRTHDGGTQVPTGSAGESTLSLGQTVDYFEGSYYQTESTSALVATAQGGTDPTQSASATASLGVKAVTVDDSYERSYMTLNGTEVPMAQALCALLHPCATYTAAVGTWTGIANAWQPAGFGVVVTESDSFTDYIDVASKGVGEFTALVGCTVRVSACVTWVDSVAGRRSVGAFVNATRSGNNLTGGTEYSNSGLFYTGNNAKTAQLTPVVLHLAAGNRLNFGKYAPANAVQSNQAYKMNWVTIEVLSVD